MSEELTVGQAAELLGVSPRTLRYWDAVGLLSPSYRAWNDYRLYTEGDLAKALDILMYRATGMSLADIAEVIAGEVSLRERLERQRRHLDGQIAHLRRMRAAVDEMLDKEDATVKEHIAHLDAEWEKYQDEAFERWGDTPEWEQSQAKQASMGAKDWEAAQQEMADFNRELQAAQEDGVAPGSDRARELVLRHRAQISQWYECTPDRQVCLARMYVADPRFDAAYEGRAGYLLSLVEKQAEAEGVDLENVHWQ